MGTIARTREAQRNAPATTQQPAKSLTTMVNSILDGEGYRRRFDELLGKRTPQFVSGLITLLNGSNQLKQAFFDSPVTVIQSALKAATYDLPIDPSLGFAYIVPFRNKGTMEAQFIMGYKGMLQLAQRTGAYSRINVTDVREGELQHYDRLTEDIDISWIDNDEERSKAPIIGYVAFFRLINGMEKTIFMSLQQIDAHEKAHRKGDNRGMGWNKFYEAMCRKTVLRKLIGSWGLMSIDYQTANAQTLAAAAALATGNLDDDSLPDVADDIPEVDYNDVDPETGEVLTESGEAES